MDDFFLTKQEAPIFPFNLPNFLAILRTVAMLLFHLELVAGTQKQPVCHSQEGAPGESHGKAVCPRLDASHATTQSCFQKP